MSMLAPVTHFLPVTTIRRTRILPIPGKVVIRKGQKVSPTDVVAEANLSPEHLLLDIARGIGLPESQADKQIKVRAGDEVDAGDVVAGPVGIARRVVRAPKAGRVVLAGSGQILLELDSRPFELKAGTVGTVVELIDGRGAEIETTGALIQGMWGNGKVEFGLLSVLARSPQDVLTRDRLDVSQRGTIIIGGILNDPDIFAAAADIPLRGMILSSMDSALIPAANKARFPILIIEGFGQIPMNPKAFKLLSTSDRREAALNAEPWDRLSGNRPEVIISLPSSGEVTPPKEMDLFKVEQKVRVFRATGKSTAGTVVEIHPGVTTLQSGVRAMAADVRLESGELIVVPLANLEVLD